MRRLVGIIGFVLLVALGTLFAGNSSVVVVPAKVARLIVPVLDLSAQARLHPTKDWQKGSPGWEASALIGKLLKQQKASADEALVVLLRFYIGESTGEDVQEEVTNRGSRMLPLLRKYEDRRVVIPGREHRYEKLAVDSQMIKEARNYIEQGK